MYGTGCEISTRERYSISIADRIRERFQSGPKTWGNQRKAAGFGPALEPISKSKKDCPIRDRRDSALDTTEVVSIMSTPKEIASAAIRISCPIDQIPNGQTLAKLPLPKIWTRRVHIFTKARPSCLTKDGP